MSDKFHQEALVSICRVCGHKLYKNFKEFHKYECKPTPVQDARKEIDGVWGINTWTDSVKSFPTYICHRCGRKIRHDVSNSRPGMRCQKHPNINWQETNHSNEFCIMCSNYKTMMTKNWIKVSWPTTQEIDKPVGNNVNKNPPFVLNHSVNIFDNVQSETPEIFSSMEIIGRSVEECTLFTCAICLSILYNCVQCPCHHNFCSSCLSKYFQFYGSQYVTCPICQSIVNFYDVNPSPDCIVIPLNHLNVSCYDCGEMGSQPTFSNHQCKKKPTLIKSSNPISNQNVQSAQSTSRNAGIPNNPIISDAATLLEQYANMHEEGSPLPTAVEKMTDKYIKLKIKASTNNTVTVRTGGTPIKLQKVHTPRKATSETTRSYQKQRRKLIDEFSSNIHKGEDQSSKENHAASLDVDSSLAMSRQMKTPWDSLDVVRRVNTDDSTDTSPSMSSSYTNYDQTIDEVKKERRATIDKVKKKKEMVAQIVSDLGETSFADIEKNDMTDDAARIFELRQDIQKLEDSTKKEFFVFGKGPLVAGLDDTLKKNNIKRQNFHGKTFNGNQVKQCCQTTAIQDLAGTPHKVLGDMDDADGEIPLSAFREATEIARWYTTVITKFACMHQHINHGRNLTPQELSEAEKSIEDFMDCFRNEIPGTRISLKLHFLEDHVFPQMQELRAGLGKMNEQGGENQHRKHKKEEQLNSNLQHQPLQHMLTVMTQQLTSSLPDVQSKMLYQKKRQKSDE